jgi:hypothetical protein
MLNQSVSRIARAGGVMAVGFSLLVGAADAGCNCGGRGHSSFSGSYGPVADPMMMSGDVYAGTIADTQWMGNGVGYALPMTPEVGPPPGTLGQTYQRPMRPIPVDKHPRISIIDVRAPGATAIKVYGTNEFRTKDGFTGFQDRKDASVWRFESEPLTPGVPHIYRVVAKYGETSQERYLRLVPGRIVTLDF